jgi:hypothetical protein
LLCCVVVAAGVVLDAEGAEALSGDDVLAAVLEENGRLRAENAELRVSLAEVLARDAERDAELERLRADLAVLQRLVFGRSSEKSRPGPPHGDGGAADESARTGSAGAARGGNAARGRGRGGGITRIFRGLRCSGISRAAGTAARSAGSRSPRCRATGPGSSWTGR